ncbi:hypothetical protein ACU686_21085 [Yinghuangia aomiensis]
MVSKLNRRLSAADISETPRSRRFAVAISVNPGAACTWASPVPAKPGDRDPAFGEQRDQRVLHLGQAAGHLFDAGHRAAGHGGEDG